MPKSMTRSMRPRNPSAARRFGSALKQKIASSVWPADTIVIEAKPTDGRKKRRLGVVVMGNVGPPGLVAVWWHKDREITPFRTSELVRVGKLRTDPTKGGLGGKLTPETKQQLREVFREHGELG